MTAHEHTLEAIAKHVNTEAHAEQKILELWEEAKKQKQWFEDHMASNADLAKQVEQILKNQIVGMEERHAKEAQLWADSMRHGPGDIRRKSTRSSCPSMSCGPRRRWGPNEFVPC